MVSEIKADKLLNQSGDQDSGIDLSTNDVVKINTAGATKVIVDASGQLGIGVATASAGAIAAGRNIAAVKGTDTPLDKALKESLIDARKATTASQKSKAKNDLLKMLFTQRRDSDKFRLEMAKFVNTIQNQSDEMALKTWEGLDPASKMAAMGLIGEEEEVEELMKDPDKYIQAIRSAISKFASTNRPTTATKPSQLVNEFGTVQIQSATGGSIPNTLAKAGISSIRRI